MLATSPAIDITQHLGLVRHIAGLVQHQPALDFDDLVAEGNLALLRAARMFDPQRGTSFSSYAGKAIARRLWRLASRHRRSFGQALPGDVAEPVPDQRPAAQVAALLARLPLRQRRAVELRFGLDGMGPRSYRQIAAVMGGSHERVRYMVKRAMERLRD